MSSPRASSHSPGAGASGGTTATSVEAVRSLARAARLIERASGDVGLAHYRVLSAIAAGEDRASRVAERFELGRPTVSAAVDALCRAGLIERAPVATDQRAVALQLTSKGKGALEEVEAEMARVLDELCRRLPGGAADQALTTMAALGEALDARAAVRHARGDASSSAPSAPRTPPA
jgi:DNA-binding MarR family transcriptional regulator